MKLPKLQSEHNLHPELEQSFHQATRCFHFHRDALSELPMSDQILFEQFGQGPYATPEFSCLHTAIEAQALQRPEAIAAIHEGREITYQELNEKANQLAQFLSQRGIGQGDAVGIFLTRSIPMLIGILATLKLGAFTFHNTP
jgi:non-ribosomal peptide synthetase component F